jgi:hypothetical protein
VIYCDGKSCLSLGPKGGAGISAPICVHQECYGVDKVPPGEQKWFDFQAIHHTTRLCFFFVGSWLLALSSWLLALGSWHLARGSWLGFRFKVTMSQFQSFHFTQPFVFRFDLVYACPRIWPDQTTIRSWSTVNEVVALCTPRAPTPKRTCHLPDASCKAPQMSPYCHSNTTRCKRAGIASAASHFRPFDRPRSSARCAQLGAGR